MIVTSKLWGGLGNNLFQIATSYSYAKRFNKDLIFYYENIFENHKPITIYLNTIFSKIKFEHFNNRNFKIYKEKSFNWSEISHYKENVYLDGYFQSEKYFKDFKNDILDLFINEDIINKLKNKYSNILKNSCSVHVRHGDYLKLQDFHPIQSIDYYKKSMNIMKSLNKNTNFLFFSDDIKWCKNNFKDKNIIFIENEFDYEDLYLMSLCENNIIANSSFSWWSAWLNKNNSKTIISPTLWFGKKLNNNTIDLIPKKWIKI